MTRWQTPSEASLPPGAPPEPTAITAALAAREVRSEGSAGRGNCGYVLSAVVCLLLNALQLVEWQESLA